MKKLTITILAALLTFFTLTSCVTTVEAQDGVYTSAVIDVDDIEMAITYGTPYMMGSSVLYYIYNNLYYYPFYNGGYYYYYVYTRPLARYPRYWRPLPRNHWFRNGHYHNNHGFVGHDRYRGLNRPNIGYDRPRHDRPNIRHDRPNVRHDRSITRPDRRRDRSSSTRHPDRSFGRPNIPNRMPSHRGFERPSHRR